MNTEISKTRKIVGWVIASLLLALYIKAASGKFLHPEQLDGMGLASWRVIIALGEIASALLFFFPKTNIFGTLLLSTFMGGAIIIHMIHGYSLLLPVGVLLLVWANGFVRNPEFFAKFVP